MALTVAEGSTDSLEPRLSSSFSSLAVSAFRTASDEKLDESLGSRLSTGESSVQAW